MKLPWLFYSTDFLNHLTAGHPESPERLQAILKTLDQHHLLQALTIKEPKLASEKFIKRIHQPSYMQHLESFCQTSGNGSRIDEDTVVSTGTYQAARKSAGAAIDMVNALCENRCQTAFALVRPPGHHAMPGYTMGFCFFNNAALAALYALEQLGLKRVAILDWDAHHGNGMEHIFYADPRVLTVSWHQYPNWPGTGEMEAQGEGPGLGFNLNIPLPLDYGNEAFLLTFERLVSPALERFQPELILVCAGYDAHFADPLTQLGLTATGFAQLTEAVMRCAEKLSVDHVGFLLEGGYHVQALANSVSATLNTLLNQESRIFNESLGQPPESDLILLRTLIDQIRLNHPLLKKECLQ